MGKMQVVFNSVKLVNGMAVDMRGGSWCVNRQCRVVALSVGRVWKCSKCRKLAKQSEVFVFMEGDRFEVLV